MRIGRKHLRILVVSLSVLIACLGTSSALYSNSYAPTLDQIATAKEFHLSTTNVLNLTSPGWEVGISGNLFSFGHILPEPEVGVPAPGVFVVTQVMFLHMKAELRRTALMATTISVVLSRLPVAATTTQD